MEPYLELRPAASAAAAAGTGDGRLEEVVAKGRSRFCDAGGPMRDCRPRLSDTADASKGGGEQGKAEARAVGGYR